MTRGIRAGAARKVAPVALVFLVAAMILAFPGFSGPALGQRPSSREATPDARTGTPPASPIASPMASPVVAEADPGSFAAFGYDDVTARGMFTSATFTFPLPLVTSAPEGGRLDLRYSHSPLLIGDLSTMTVLVNGQSIESVHLVEETAEGASLVVDLPTLGEDAEAVQVTLAFHLRLTREACEVPDDPALWVTIHDTSRIELPVGAGEAEIHLADTPRLLTRSMEETGAGPVIVLPDRAHPEEMDAAGIVAYQLGRWSGMADEPIVLGDVVPEVPGPEQAAILVGTGESLELSRDWGPLSWDGERFLLDGEPVPEGHGVLAVRQQPVPQVLVSGASPDAVLLAANALSRPMDWPAFDAPVVVITGELPEVNQGRYAWGQEAASFAQLGLFRQDVTGPGEHFIDIPLERPADWVLQEGSRLELDLQVSPSVRSETSWVRVTVNGQDIGTEPLRVDEEGVQTYTFDIPVGIANADLDGQPERELMVQVRVFLDYPHEACESIDPQSTWAALLPTSALYLPHGTYDGMDLGRFPAGLVSVDDPTGLSVIVPEHPTPEERQAALQAIAAVGRWNAWTEPVTPQVMTPAEISDEEMQDRSIIVVGGRGQNEATESFGDDVLPAVEPPVYTSADDPYGVLAMGASPWAEGKTALVLSGSGEEGEGILLAAAALGDGEVLSGMQGTRIAVTGDLGPQTVVGANPANEVPEELAPQILPDERPWIERIAAWQVVGAIVLVAFLALVIGVVMLRWVRGGTR